MHVFECWFFDRTNLLILFLLFSIYLLSFIKIFTGKHIFYAINSHYCLDHQIHVFNHWLIYPNKLSILFWLFYILSLSIINQITDETCFWYEFLSLIDHSILQLKLTVLLLCIFFGFSIKTKNPKKMRRSNTVNLSCNILWSVNDKHLSETSLICNLINNWKR